MLRDTFHPYTAAWFERALGAPTEPQATAWPEIASGEHTLLAAPTGAGKTLAAFLVGIDRLVRRAAKGALRPGPQIVYVSPLKALSHDIGKNLERPLAGIRAEARAAGHELAPIHHAVRTGDTPSAARQAMLRNPPHILVTTPESLYLLLTSEKGRGLLPRCETVIVDEIHAVAGSKRGAHLALALERLESLCARAGAEQLPLLPEAASPGPTRVGLSATQEPIEAIGRFLVGARRVDAENRPACRIVNAGFRRSMDLGLMLPDTPLGAVCTHEQWAEIDARIAEAVEAHTSTLIFVNTRRLAERLNHRLEERLGAEAVTCHHGSMARDARLDAEKRLKNGELRAVVATASLELGIDVGEIDLVIQIGSPRAVSTFVQRSGRAGHALGRAAKARLVPLTRDELIEALALFRAVRRGRLDALAVPEAPLDILAQHVVAAAAAEPWDETALFELLTGAWPYRRLSRAAFDAVLSMVTSGEGLGRYLHRDRVNGKVRARRGARLTALTCGGAIPETGDYRVVTEEGTFVGTVNEDFAIESMAGDVFLLGAHSWRVRYVRGDEMTVADAEGAPATVPFWIGEAPGRTVELSDEVGAVREAIADALGENGEPEPAARFLAAEGLADGAAAEQAAAYVAAQRAAVGCVPTQRRVVFERFFDDTGGTQLVIHAPFGARITKAWGLALRKRFCRNFDFELQAAADDNGVVLSIGPTHGFPLERMVKLLDGDDPATAREALEQAVLAAAPFQVRWRWNVTRALLVRRQQGGKRTPPALQRFRSDDLLTAVFPAQTACQENRPERIEIPDHPLVRQTVHDCLHEAMDAEGFLEALRAIAAGACAVELVDTREASPFAHELLNANPYAFLDDAPLEERRARAVQTPRSLDAEAMESLARPDAAAVAEVRAGARPTARDADELHDALRQAVALPAAEAEAGWAGYLRELARAKRATRVRAHGRELWAPAEELAGLRLLFPDASLDPPIAPAPAGEPPAGRAEAVARLLRGRLSMRGPATAGELADELALGEREVGAALEALEAQGELFRGRFDEADESAPPQWCARGLLQRIHRLTRDRARAAVRPAQPEAFVRFLLAHHGITDPPEGGLEPLAAILGQLEGHELQAGAWEKSVLPARLAHYEPAWLDALCARGRAVWGRLAPPAQRERHGLTRTVPLTVAQRADLGWLLPADRPDPRAGATASAQRVLGHLEGQGALFADDLAALTGGLPDEVAMRLGELAALGLATADTFAPVRASGPSGAPEGGRWSRFPGPGAEAAGAALEAGHRAERWARLLLRRYGVVFRDLLAREGAAPPWRVLAGCYRRLEARGEVRGGRFVDGVAGEQFATEEAVEGLRAARDAGDGGEEAPWLVLSAADPLNLAGIVGKERRVPAVHSHTIALRGGRFVAARLGAAVRWLAPVDEASAERALRLLFPEQRGHVRLTETDRAELDRF